MKKKEYNFHWVFDIKYEYAEESLPLTASSNSKIKVKDNNPEIDEFMKSIINICEEDYSLLYTGYHKDVLGSLYLDFCNLADWEWTINLIVEIRISNYNYKTNHFLRTRTKELTYNINNKSNPKPKPELKAVDIKFNKTHCTSFDQALELFMGELKKVEDLCGKQSTAGRYTYRGRLSGDYSGEKITDIVKLKFYPNESLLERANKIGYGINALKQVYLSNNDYKKYVDDVNDEEFLDWVVDYILEDCGINIELTGPVKSIKSSINIGGNNMKRYIKAYEYGGYDYLSQEEASDYRRRSNRRIRESGGRTIRFAPKAIVTDNGDGDFVLTSYDTDVAEVRDGRIVYADYHIYSRTTDKHIRDFLSQYADYDEFREWNDSKHKEDWHS